MVKVLKRKRSVEETIGIEITLGELLCDFGEYFYFSENGTGEVMFNLEDDVSTVKSGKQNLDASKIKLTLKLPEDEVAKLAANRHNY